jgi:hypothetical protein
MIVTITFWLQIYNALILGPKLASVGKFTIQANQCYHGG